jgi:ligand-binding sensor domain-containing protein
VVLQQSIRALKTALLFFLLLSSFPVQGQQPVFKNYSVKDGLPSSEVYQVMQDSKGYMWFCTDAGVSRYDGYSFRNFSSRNGLKDNTVFGSYEDLKGRIWFRTMSGKLFYSQNDSIHGIVANKRLSQAVKNGLITSLHVDRSDTIWCGLVLGQGFFRIAPPYREEDFTFFKLPNFGYIVELSTSEFIWGAARPPGDILNVYNHHAVVMKYSKQGIPQESMGNMVWPPGASIIKTSDGDFIMITDKGVFSYNKQEKFYLPGVHFISLYEDRQSNLWLGTGKDGVFCFEKGNLKSLKVSHYLKGLSVSSIIQDSEGGFWFTTLESGVFYMASTGFLYYSRENGLSDNKVLTITPGRYKGVFAGMANGDICLLSKDTFGLYKENGIWPGENSIYRFFQDSANKKIIAGAACSFWFCPSGNYSRHYLAKGKDIQAYKCFTKDTFGNIWGGNHLLLTKLGKDQNSKIESYPSDSRILSLYTDAENTIWTGCVNGLWSFKQGKFTFQGDGNALFKSRIEDIKVSADSTWWFATKGNGLIVKRKNKTITIDEQSGLSSNLCKSVFIGQDKVIWVGTNNGINRITMKEWGVPVVEVFSSEDGLLSNEINEVIKIDNCIWAATNQGVVSFDSRTAFSNQSPPPVYITSLEINSVKKQLRDTFRLNYFENYLKINFTGISYKRSSKMKYQYMLEGIDVTWNYTVSTNLQYTTLPPGAYTFIVYALNNDGVKSLKPARFYFVIAKPFWKEWWFISLVFAFLIGSTIAVVTYRIAIFKKRGIEKLEVSRKIADLKLMALRAQMNPHFIFNSINSIQLFILKNDSESAHKHLSRFSRLIRNVLENSKHEYVSLAVEIETLEHYIELERLRFSSKFTYLISIDEHLDVKNSLISPLLIQPYVENAIWHGLMHSKDRPGVLQLRLEKVGALLKCTIEDNGIGRKHSAEFKKGKDHKSTGLSLNKERVEIINTLHNSSAGVQFVDMEDENGLPVGTQVVIFIPININYSEYS